MKDRRRVKGERRREGSQRRRKAGELSYASGPFIHERWISASCLDTLVFKS